VKLLCNSISLENEVVSNFVLVENAIWLQAILFEIDVDNAGVISQKRSDDSSKLWILRRSCLDSKAEHFMAEELRYESA
jgi:hypothetical protein